MRDAPASKGDKKGNWSLDLVLDLYSNLLTEIWEIVSALIGEAVLAFLFNLSTRKLGEKYPFLLSLKASEEGISWGGVMESCQEIPPVEVHRGFQGLINHLLHLFSTLAEGVISREIFPKVFPRLKEAERIISPR